MAIIKKEDIFTSYREKQSLNANGPYQYAPGQLEEIQKKQNERQIALQYRALNSNALRGSLVGVPSISTHITGTDSIGGNSKGELIKIKSISKEEFKRLQREDIMKEWERLINLDNDQKQVA